MGLLFTASVSANLDQLVSDDDFFFNSCYISKYTMMICGMKAYPVFLLVMCSKHFLCSESVDFVLSSFTSQHCSSDIIYINQMRKQVEKVKIACLESYQW